MVAMMKGAASYLFSHLPSIPYWGSKPAAPVPVPPDQRASAAASAVFLQPDSIPYDPAVLAEESASTHLLSYEDVPHISSALALGDLTDEVSQWLIEQGWTSEDIQNLSAAKEQAQLQSGDGAQALNEELMKQAVKKERGAAFNAIPKYVLSDLFVQNTRKQLNERIAACRRMLRSL